MPNCVISTGGWLDRGLVLSGTSSFSILGAIKVDTPSISGHYDCAWNLTNVVDFLDLFRMPPSDTPPNTLQTNYKHGAFSGDSSTVSTDATILGHWVHCCFVWDSALNQGWFYALLEGFNPLSPAYLLTPSLGTVVMVDQFGNHPAFMCAWMFRNDSPAFDSTEVGVSVAQGHLILTQQALPEADVLAQFAQRAPTAAVMAATYSYLAFDDPTTVEHDLGSTATDWTKVTGFGSFASYTGEPSEWAGGGGATGTLAESTAKQTEAITGSALASGTLAEVTHAQTEAITGAVRAAGALTETTHAQTESITAHAVATGTLAESTSRQTESIAAQAVAGGTLAESSAKQTEALAGAVPAHGTLGELTQAQVESIAAHTGNAGTLAEATHAQTESITAQVSVAGTLAEASSKQTEALAGVVPAHGVLTELTHAQTESATAAVPAHGALAEATTKQVEALTAAARAAGSLAETTHAQTEALAGAVPAHGTLGELTQAQVESIVASAAHGTLAESTAKQTEALAGHVAVTGTIAEVSSAQVEAIVGTHVIPSQSRVVGWVTATRMGDVLMYEGHRSPVTPSGTVLGPVFVGRFNVLADAFVAVNAAAGQALAWRRDDRIDGLISFSGRTP